MGDDGGAGKQGAGRAREAARQVVAWAHAVRVRRRLARGFGPRTARSREPEPFQRIARIMWAAPEGSREAGVAARAAAEAAANPFALRELLAVFRAQYVGGAHRGDQLARLRPRRVPSHVTAFLLEPVDGAVHRPGVRAVAYLDAPELPLPGPVYGSRGDLAQWLVHAAHAESPPAASFGPLSGLLAGTDQPHLLVALRSAFVSGVRDGAHHATHPDISGASRGGSRPFRLWQEREGAPTLLARMLRANPHLPLLPPPAGQDGPPQFGGAHAVLLALVTGRPDQIDPIVRATDPTRLVESLDLGLLQPGPPELLRECRRILRRLDDPAARDEVCRRALNDGSPEMRAAVAEAGYLPSVLDEEGRAAFLFATEQWERYDAADPRGRLVADYFAHGPSRRPPQGGEWWWWALKYAAMTAAARSGRRTPLPPSPTTSAPARRTGPIGGWPTSYTGGFGTH
ncbi:hypothetical protein ACGF0J_25565 [Nonomuraea sp. NPDC047897]|uniref:hypothetical protein n=1 Tax=Nonomuraea sp. NPDC047897 TaxID=3364346 RepID=UPI003723CC6E